MENAIKTLNKFVRSVQKHETLSSKVRLKLKESPLETPPKIYYNLTELCNPQASYWTRMQPQIQDSRKLKIKYGKGNRIHEKVERWLSEFDNFVGNESILDGTLEGFERIRGKVDCLLGDSIVEIKTKEELPNIENVVSIYPQDVEQIAFYSVMHPEKPRVNYMIFVKNSSPYDLIVFKVIIKDMKKVGELLNSRRNLLDKALAEKNPSFLGRCRYKGNFCKFEENKICECDKLEDLPLDINDYLEIIIEEPLSKKLIEIRDKDSDIETYSISDVLMPRKSFIKRNIQTDESFIPNEVKEDRKDLLKKAIKKLEMNLVKAEFNDIKKANRDKRLSPYWYWLKIADTKAPEGEIIPYSISVNLSSNKSSTESTDPYRLAELAVIAAAHNKRRGFIFVIYPNLGNQVQVFEVNFKEDKEFFKTIKDILDSLDNVKVKEDIEKLPICPRYCNSKKDCVLNEECNGNGKKGCLYYI
jgi:hypothetical protein